MPLAPVRLTLGDTEFFKGIPTIPFEGPESDNPLAFRYYDADRKVGGKTMREHLRFAVCYWHTFGGTGADPFGAPTKAFPWLSSSDPLRQGMEKMDAAFEFISKLGIPFYCFHDYDLVAEGGTWEENDRRLAAMVEYAQKKQAASGIQLLWGTANLFSHPRYMNGAATNPDFAVLAHAGAQVKNALDATIALGGRGYVFWGGREGYMSLLNTQMKRELDHLARFLEMARDYARKNGFQGEFYIEPKPMEPSKHQYDFDAATTIGFLREYGLDNDFKLNVEVNHATLALHSFQHELLVAANAGMLGSIDANRGDYQNGWDTDQFPNNVLELTEAMLVILEAGGFSGGGVNFDAKTRRNSTDLIDLFYAHIGGMDVFARALLAAHNILETSEYSKIRAVRYASFDSGDGLMFEKGKFDLESLSVLARKSAAPIVQSGRQEWFEWLINRYV